MNKCFISLALFSVMLVTSSCQDDDDRCDAPRPGEQYTLSATAIDILAPYTGITRVIFKNNAGDEVPFTVSARRDSIVMYQYAVPCTFDPAGVQTVEGTSQIMSLTLVNPTAIPDPLYLTLYEFPRPDTSAAFETYSISLSPLLSGDYQAGDELFYFVFGTDNNQLTVLDSLVAGGKTFYEVYQPTQITPAPKYAVSYTLNKGIVRIVNPQSGQTLIYDRTE